MKYLITSGQIKSLCEEYAYMRRIRGQAVEIYVNPTLDELKIVASKKSDRIRFTANALEKKVFVWDAMLAIHYDVLPLLGNDYIDIRPNIIGGVAELKGSSAVMIGWDNFFHVMDVMDTSNRENAIQFLTKLFSFDWSWMDKYFQASDYIKKRRSEFDSAILSVKERRKSW